MQPPCHRGRYRYKTRGSNAPLGSKEHATARDDRLHAILASWMSAVRLVQVARVLTCHRMQPSATTCNHHAGGARPHSLSPYGNSHPILAFYGNSHPTLAPYGRRRASSRSPSAGWRSSSGRCVPWRRRRRRAWCCSTAWATGLAGPCGGRGACRPRQPRRHLDLRSRRALGERRWDGRACGYADAHRARALTLLHLGGGPGWGWGVGVQYE